MSPQASWFWYSLVIFLIFFFRLNTISICKKGKANTTFVQEGKLRCAVMQWLAWGLGDLPPLWSAIFHSVAPQIPCSLLVLLHKNVLFCWNITVWKKLSPWLTNSKHGNLECFCWKVRELVSHIGLKNQDQKSKFKKQTPFSLLPLTKCYFYRLMVTQKKILQSVMQSK